jgi:hypothetical protein
VAIPSTLAIWATLVTLLDDVPRRCMDDVHGRAGPCVRRGWCAGRSPPSSRSLVAHDGGERDVTLDACGRHLSTVALSRSATALKFPTSPPAAQQRAAESPPFPVPFHNVQSL